MKKICALLVLIILCGCTHDTISPEPIHTLKVEIYDRGDVPEGAGTVTDNAVTNWICSEFGKKNNIDVQFVPIVRDSQNELSVLISSGDAPDIFFSYSYDGMYNYFISGDTVDLSEYISSDSPLYDFIGEELLELGKINDNQFIIPAKRLIKGRQAQLVRTDWLDRLGMQAPTNTDEFYAMLRAFQKYDPGNNGVNNIPYGVSANTSNFLDLIYSFMDTDFNERDMNCANHIDNPGYREGLRFMNKLFNEGLLSPYFEYDKDRKKVESDIAKGYVGFFCDDLGRPLQSGGVYEQLLQNLPEARLEAVDTWTDSNGKHPKCIYSDAGIYIAVSSTCKYPEDAVRYLEWMCNPDVMRVLQYGFEGVNYKMDSDGIPRIISDDTSKLTHWYTIGFDTGIIVNGKYTTAKEKILAFNANATVDPQLYMQCYKNSMRDGWTLREMIPSTLQITDSTYRYMLKTEIISKCITCPTQTFDSEFDKIRNRLREVNVDNATKDSYNNYDKMYK